MCERQGKNNNVSLLLLFPLKTGGIADHPILLCILKNQRNEDFT